MNGLAREVSLCCGESVFLRGGRRVYRYCKKCNRCCDCRKETPEEVSLRKTPLEDAKDAEIATLESRLSEAAEFASEMAAGKSEAVTDLAKRDIEIAELRELIDRSDLERGETMTVQVGLSTVGDGKDRLYHKGYVREVKKATELLQQRARDARKIAKLREALDGLRVDPPSGCYCDAQFAMHGARPSHSDECQAATKALEETK